MSPVSKKRPNRRKKKRPASQQDELSAHLAAITRDLRSLRVEPDPLEAETYVSQLIGDLTDGADPAADELSLLRFIEIVAERGGDEMLALLRVLAELSPMPAARISADYAAERLVRRGSTEPRWVGDLGRARAVKVRTFGDVYGDQTAVICTFSGPVRAHALIAFINLTHPGGFLTDIVLTAAIDQALVSFETAARDSAGLSVLNEIGLEDASRILRDALAESYRVVDVSDEVKQLRPLLGGRLTTLPDPSPAPKVDGNTVVGSLLETATAQQRDALVAWRVFGGQYDAGRIDRVSPTKILAFAEMWNGDATDAADAIRAVAAGQELVPSARNEIDETIAEAFPGAVQARVDTSWLDEITG